MYGTTIEGASKQNGSSWGTDSTYDKNKINIHSIQKISYRSKNWFTEKFNNYRKTPPQRYNTQKFPLMSEFSRVRFKMDEYENHPTQKPYALLKRIILTSSNEQDLVLDPFSGSFTTGFACKMLNRKFIGFEKNNEYIKIGIRRLELGSEFSKKELEKVKHRKTNNKSKKDHGNTFTPKLFN